MLLRAVLVSVALLALAPSAAFASLANEQRQGQALAAQLQSGAKTCNDLSSEDLDHVGEYVMGRALGSTAAHQAMNDRMSLMVSDQTEGRLHQPMGGRFAGCAAPAGTTIGSCGYMGPGMMAATTATAAGAQMMRSTRRSPETHARFVPMPSGWHPVTISP